MSEGKQKLNIRVAPVATSTPNPTAFSVPPLDENTRGSNLQCENKVAPIYGCLGFSIIFMAIITNIDYAVIPKEAKIPGTEKELQRIVILFVANGITLASNYFDFHFIIGKEEANSGRNLIYQYFLNLFSYNLAVVGMGTLRKSELLPFDLNGFVIGGIAANISSFAFLLFIWIRLDTLATKGSFHCISNE